MKDVTNEATNGFVLKFGNKKDLCNFNNFLVIVVLALKIFT